MRAIRVAVAWALAAAASWSADEAVVAAFERAERYFAAKDYASAIIVYRDVLDKDPRGPYAEAAAFRLGMCNFALGEYDAAERAFKKFEEGWPNSPYLDDAIFLSAQSHFRMGDYHRAFERLLRVLAFGEGGRYYKRAVRGLGNLADEALTAEQLAKRLEDYHRSAEAAATLLKLGKHELSRGDYHKASVVLAAVARDYGDRDEGKQATKLLAEIREKVPRERGVVGVLLPLSGEYEPYGRAMRAAVEVAAAEFNGRAGDEVIKLVVADTQGTAEGAVAGAQHLIFVERVAAILGPASSEEVRAVAPLLAASQVPCLSPAATDGSLAKLNDYVFLCGLTRDNETETIVRYATGHLGLKRFAVLYPANSYGREMKEAFARAAAAAGATVAGEVEYPLIDFTLEPDKREINYSPYTKEVKWLRPDAVFLPGHFDEVVRLLPQLVFSDVSAYVLGANGWNENRVIRVAGKYVEGTYYTAAFWLDAPETEVRNFVAAFRRQTGEYPNYLAAQAYDAACIVFAAATAPASEGAAAYLAGVKGFKGVSGTITLRGPDGTLAKELTILTVKEGEVIRAPE